MSDKENPKHERMNRLKCVVCDGKANHTDLGNLCQPCYKLVLDKNHETYPEEGILLVSQSEDYKGDVSILFWHKVRPPNAKGRVDAIGIRIGKGWLETRQNKKGWLVRNH